ncbi:MAG: tripartite tricarboxylate transporter substrate binding protein [Aquincola sp.]|nr:tripartite tricarboxylate transporter substrate binding protein [Aquincola sp.]MDH5330809.1 tripartite tricarboxylate transporter substrate binding protein [Aquincola sp.]
MTMRRRAALLATASMLAAPRAAAAVDFPSRPIALWVPWPAGGATDATLRLLAEIAGRHLGQPVIVENRGGAGGTLAMPVLQNAAPDGYTIAQMPQPVFRAPWTQKVLWDPIRDTTPIIQLSGVTFGLLTHPGSGLRSVDDMLNYARAHAGALKVATNGVGTTPHMLMDQLMSSHGLTFVHVPYRGTAEQMVALAAGHVDVGVNSSGFAPFVDSGRLLLLAVFSEQRSKRWPQVPTARELGFNLAASSPYGLAGPRGMSAPIVRTLHDAFHAALFDAVHVAELAKFDQIPDYLGPADYARAMRDAYAAEKRIVDQLGLAKGG